MPLKEPRKSAGGTPENPLPLVSREQVDRFLAKSMAVE